MFWTEKHRFTVEKTLVKLIFKEGNSGFQKKKGKDHKNINDGVDFKCSNEFRVLGMWKKKKKREQKKEVSLGEKQQHISSVWCDDDNDGVMRIERISRVIWKKKT
jgi:hypothetical protein